jgi:phosphopantetheine adenylyltransferase
MHNIRVEYGADATVNLGNFENVKPSLKISADVAEGEDTKAVVRQLRELVDSFIEHVVAEAKAEARG